MHRLIATILIPRQNNQVTDHLPTRLEIIGINKLILITAVVVWEDVFNIEGVTFALAIHVNIKL